MSANIDKSLGEIISTRKSATRGRGRPRKVATTAPSNGVKKNVANKTATKNAPRAAASAPAPTKSGLSKIIVSNMPSDVNESQIKEYFATSLTAPVRRVDITYGPNGVSRGIATILFSKPSSATEAAAKLNGVLVDGRPMRVEVVVDAKSAAATVTTKTLGERIAKPKDQPKKAVPAKGKENNAKESTRGGAAAGGTRGGRRGRPGRPKRKTADELDAEMTDYFGANTAGGDAAPAAANGTAAAPAAGGDSGMDEVS